MITPRDPALFVDKVTASVGSVSSLIIHTALFIGVFILGFAHIAPWELLLLVLTTVVSLEAIYLAIFIQFTVNRNTKSLQEVEEDLDEIQEDVEELSEDMDEIQEDIEDIQEDVEVLSEEETPPPVDAPKKTLDELATDIRRILDDLEQLKGGK